MTRHNTPVNEQQFTMPELARQIAHACELEEAGKIDSITYRMLVGNFARAVLNKIGE